MQKSFDQRASESLQDSGPADCNYWYDSKACSIECDTENIAKTMAGCLTFDLTHEVKWVDKGCGTECAAKFAKLKSACSGCYGSAGTDETRELLKAAIDDQARVCDKACGLVPEIIQSNCCLDPRACNSIDGLHQIPVLCPVGGLCQAAAEATGKHCPDFYLKESPLRARLLGFYTGPPHAPPLPYRIVWTRWIRS